MYDSCVATGFDGETYEHGEKYTTLDDCETCECIDGEWDCLINPACIPDTTKCNFEGSSYSDGDTFNTTDGCRTCSCDNGTVECTLIPNMCCFEEGIYYLNGESFMKECNTCTCTNGEVMCTLMMCP